MTPIFHITARAAWEQAQQDGVYTAPSLNAQGFIHLSSRDQVVATANRFYSHQRDLVLLVVDPAKLTADLRYEPPDGEPQSSERFPHLYGALDLDAVIRALDFPPNQDGTWHARSSAVDGN